MVDAHQTEGKPMRRYLITAIRETGGDDFTPRREIRREWIASLAKQPCHYDLLESPDGLHMFVLRAVAFEKAEAH